MTRRMREVETLLLTMFAAVPLYFTSAIGRLPVGLFHLAMTGIVVRVALGRGPDILPARVMRWLAIAYVPFYFLDWKLLGGTAIAASTHLVLFIALYQPIESLERDNQAQRLLTTSLIFLASLATSTHITVVLFVVAFAFLMFRQLMYVSHIETTRAIGASYAEPPSAGTAFFYLAGAMLIGSVLFPMLPRVRSPFVSGFASSLPGGATALTESIDFSGTRRGNNDGTIVARVWVEESARRTFAPVRLRGMIYDRFERGKWEQTLRGIREVPSRGNPISIARARGDEAEMIVQQRPFRGKLYLPPGTYSIAGHPGRLYEGPARDTFYTYADGTLNLAVRVARSAEPLRLMRIAAVNYPVTPEVAAMARQIVGNETRPEQQAELIEQYLSTNFRYVSNATTAASPMSMEDFLLRRREGHCEYFAAGMVVLLTALDVPARIAGGYYASRMNPLTGYYAVRREDAHAWTEVWDGTRWMTFDATPPDLRPGQQGSNALGEYLSALTDSMTFVWDRYVLTFGLGDQITLIEDALEWTRTAATTIREGTAANLEAMKSPPYLLMLALLIAAGVAIVLYARGRKPLFDVLARHLRKRGIEVGPAMTMEEALRELRSQQPDAARELEPLIAMYEEERFSPRTDRSRVSALRRRLRELRA